MKKSIKDMPLFERPREKLLERGVEALSDAELLMAILGRGVSGHDVYNIAQNVLRLLEKSSGKFDVDILRKIPGVGQAKATQLAAMAEFMRRRLAVTDDIIINNAEDVFALLADLRGKKQERFVAITLTGARRIIAKRTIFIGTVDECTVHPREVFADAMTDRAAGIIVAHNHPQDDPQPSDEDIVLTNRLVDVGKLLGIDFIDHVIVGRRGYFSWQQAGML